MPLSQPKNKPSIRITTLSFVGSLLLATLLCACGGGGGGGTSAGTKSWQSAALLESTDYGDAQNPKVAMNASGEAIVVWEQVDITNTMSIYARRYSPQSGWDAVTLLENGNGVAANPVVGMDASGNAIAVWDQSDGVRTNIRHARYVSGSGWTGDSLLEFDNTSHASSPSIAMNPTGDAMVAWRQNEGTYYNIKARRYVAGSGWESVSLIELEELGDAGAPKVSISTAGNSVVVWRQNDGSSFNAWANRYDVGVGWDMATKLDNLSTDASDVNVRHDSAGKAMVVWRQLYNGAQVVISNLYRPGSGWSGVTAISVDSSGSSYAPEMASWGDEKFAWVWYQNDGLRTNITYNTYSNSTLGTPALLENDNSGSAFDPKVSIDAQGNTIVIWSLSDGTRHNLWAIAGSNATNWSSPLLIETNNTSSVAGQQLAMGSNGSAIAVWSQSDGTRTNIWFNTRQ